MKRQVSLEEISDGRLYGKKDMVRVGCGGCRGCSECCHGMGSSAVLDPMDLYRLTVSQGCSLEELLADKLELNVVDGIILPNLKMSGETEACGFLDGQGRCSIHANRPGVCRLFPLGRYWDEAGSVGTDRGQSCAVQSAPEQGRTKADSAESGPGQSSSFQKVPEWKQPGFQYFLQVHECPARNKTKVRVDRWLDLPDLDRYEQFVCEWHYFLETVGVYLSGLRDDTAIKNVNLFVLKLFFLKPYLAEGDFYRQFEERLELANKTLAFPD